MNSDSVKMFANAFERLFVTENSKLESEHLSVSLTQQTALLLLAAADKFVQIDFYDLEILSYTDAPIYEEKVNSNINKILRGSFAHQGLNHASELVFNGEFLSAKAVKFAQVSRGYELEIQAPQLYETPADNSIQKVSFPNSQLFPC